MDKKREAKRKKKIQLIKSHPIPSSTEEQNSSMLLYAQLVPFKRVQTPPTSNGIPIGAGL